MYGIHNDDRVMSIINNDKEQVFSFVILSPVGDFCPGFGNKT